MGFSSIPGVAQPGLINPGSSDISDAAPSSSDTGSGTESQTVAVSSSDTGSGVEGTARIANTGSDTASGAESNPLIAFTKTDTGVGTDSQNVATGSSGAPTSSDTVSSSESVSILSISDWSGYVSGMTPGTNLLETMVWGPATVYIASYGALEPIDTLIGTAPDSSVWTDLGATVGGVALTLKQEYEASTDIEQQIQKVNSRLKKREYVAATDLSEPKLDHFEYLMNGGVFASGSGYRTYTPPAIDRGTPLTYRAVIIDGWAPGYDVNRRHKRRRIIMRKCLSTADIVMTFTKDKQTVMPVEWVSHRVDGVISPVKIIDEI